MFTGYNTLKKSFKKKENKDKLNKGLEKTKKGFFSRLNRAIVGKSKIDAEAEVVSWCKKNDVEFLILRLPLISGPNPPGNLGALYKAIQKGYYFRIGKGSVLSIGVFISQSTKNYNRETKEITYGYVPPGSVVVPGSLPAKDGSHSLSCAVIVKTVDEQTRAKTSINELLNNGFITYPNPSKDEINLHVDATTISSYQIIDFQGRVVLSADVNNLALVKANISKLNTGTYLVKVVTPFGKAQRSIVIE